VIPVFDGHNDALTRDDHARLVTGREGGHLDLPRMRAGGMRGGIFAVFSSSGDSHALDEPIPRNDGVAEFELAPPFSHELAAAHAASAAGRLLALERSGDVVVGRSVADLDRAQVDDEGPPVAVLHLEGAEAIDPALSALELWYAAGLRSVGPVWSRPNAFAHGVPFIFPGSPDTGPGLTHAGRRLVARCAELGILIDVSHINEAGFWDVARLDAGPLVASHSAAHALSPCSRNLADGQLDAIAGSGGLVGVVFGCPFVRADMADDPDTPLSDIVRHARYIADRIGVAHVGLGSDFDGVTIPHALGDVTGLPRLLEALRSEGGFTEGELQDIAWNNWRRVLGAWWHG
jgi:membrane dipeptidase